MGSKRLTPMRVGKWPQNVCCLLLLLLLTTGRASGPKMLTAPAKSQLTIGHHPSPVKTGSV